MPLHAIATMQTKYLTQFDGEIIRAASVHFGLSVRDFFIQTTLYANYGSAQIQTTIRETSNFKIWAVEIRGNITDASNLADKHDYELVDQLEGFPNVFVFRKRLDSRFKRHAAANSTAGLKEDPLILWAEQQMSNIREKREFFPESETPAMVRWTNGQQNFRHSRQLFDISNLFVDFGFQVVQGAPLSNDELWPYQWYIHSRKSRTEHGHGITKVWEMGYTGSGVVVTVLDDGLEWKHNDLQSNYDHNASFDVNDNDNDPTPRYEMKNINSHGTRCAGEIAMARGNKKCGIGVAYNAKLGGIRCLDGEVSDLHEARALSFKNNYIDIYSSSWGPSDDGMTLDGPKRLATEALERGVMHGRKGKGVIYVWASGNGGAKFDNCNCDGYVSSIYTVSIGSVSESGHFPWYGERCASTIAVAYSSGAYSERKIPTTDIHNRCTFEHSGTSAAAPIASGIIALVLEAKPSLTWRDVQHLIVCTAEFSPLADNTGWKRNSAGFLFNSKFGFGLLNAHSMVVKALNWVTVPDKTQCLIQTDKSLPEVVPNGKAVKVLFSVNNLECPIQYLEHVQVRVTINTFFRGRVRVFLISPQKTLSVLLHPRKRDNSTQGFSNWNLTSVQFWGENPQGGEWELVVQNSKMDGSLSNLVNAELILHGMKQPGGCLRERPHRRYAEGEELINRIIDPNPEYHSDSLLENSETFASKLFGPPDSIHAPPLP